MKSNPYTYGIILTLLTYLSFGILDTIQKTAVQYHSVFVLLFVKFTFCFIFSFFIAKKNKVKKFYLSNNYKIQITRCILSVCESCFFVLSFRHLALADAHTIGSLAPVLVLVFSYFILKEKINFDPIILPKKTIFQLCSLLDNYDGDLKIANLKSKIIKFSNSKKLFSNFLYYTK